MGKMVSRTKVWCIVASFGLVRAFLDAQTPLFQAVDLQEVEVVRVTAFCQDDRGWLWVGAHEGLFLYDGHTFRRAVLPDSGAVTALYCWGRRVWVGMTTGCIAWRSTDLPTREISGMKLMFERWTPEEGLPRKAISSFAADSSGRFWIATYGEGVYYFQNGRLYNLSSAEDGLASDDVYSIAVDGQGRIWAGTDAGLSIIRLGRTREIATLEGLPDLLVTALATDAVGNVWVGTHEKGIGRYSTAQQRLDFWTLSWPFGPVTAIATLGTLEVWAGTEEKGMIRVDASSGAVHAMPASHPLAKRRIQALFKDREGILWVGPDKGGLWRAYARVGMLEAPLSHPMAVASDAAGRLWVGGAEGLYVRRGGRFERVADFNLHHVVALWMAPDSTHVWAGTYDRGAFLLDTTGRVLKRFWRANGLPDDNVLAISGDHQQVFLATFGGVARVDKNGLEVRIVEGIKRGYIYAAIRDRQGGFWFGTQGDGLYCLRAGRLIHYTQQDHPALKTIYSLAEDAHGRLWISTERQGLLYFDGSTFHRLSPVASRSTSSLPIALQTNGDGLLVVGSDQGFWWLYVRPSEGPFCPVSIDLPPLNVGLNAICRDGQGHVWLGTANGLWRVAAWNVPVVAMPEAVITSVLLLNQNAPPRTTQLAHNENYLEFTFDAVWYTQHPGLTFRYRLEGFDRYWMTTTDHQVHYSQLPPGHYVFRVKASKCTSFEGAAEARWAFSISPPFWQRGWFQVLVLSTLAALIYGWIKHRERRLRREAQQRRQATEAQLNALKAQISPHFLFNSFNTLIAVIEDNPPMAVEYVSRLSDFYRSLLATQSHDYISLQEERTRVGHYAFLLRIRYAEGFILDDRLSNVTGYVAPLSLQILIENAVKHNIVSPSRPLRVEMFADGEGYIIVRNNLQRRATPAPGTRLGLNNLTQRYQLLGAQPVIVEETETYFSVKIPLKNTLN